ncbi:hypothetical protein EDC04DRAFT_2751961 [Pisolithus marmoratus]|nr:hypothetical protein EDC04DRAFT_2751961 [Pisolithus marmoratus]
MHSGPTRRSRQRVHHINICLGRMLHLPAPPVALLSPPYSRHYVKAQCANLHILRPLSVLNYPTTCLGTHMGDDNFRTKFAEMSDGKICSFTPVHDTRVCRRSKLKTLARLLREAIAAYFDVASVSASDSIAPSTLRSLTTALVGSNYTPPSARPIVFA